MSSFVQVVDSGSFSGAARQLKLSQAAVTGHVQSLEQQLGIRLLNRTTRKISLTEEGAQLHQRCTRILAEVAEVECFASSLQLAPRGRLRLNTDVTLARVIAPVVSDYVLIYPEMSVELIMTDQIGDLVEAQFDLAIHAGSVLVSSLIQRRLGKAQRVICASPIYLARCGTPRTPEDLAAHNCLNVNNCRRTDRWRFASRTGEHEIEVAGNLSSNSIEAVRAAALTGQGICLLPLLSVAEDLKTGRLLRLLPDYVAADATIQAIYPGGRHLSTRVRTFLDFVAKRLREVDVDRIDPGKTRAETPVAREPAGSTTAPPKATSPALSPTIAAPIANASGASSSCALG
jgi:DNA-binding transcriptional LysR family regulator